MVFFFFFFFKQKTAYEISACLVGSEMCIRDSAVKERLIVRNPANDCVPPKIPKHEMKILPPEQIKSYLAAAEQRGVLPMFYLELISGLRKGELVALQWSDLDIENKTISVSKQAGRNNTGEPDITRPKTENSIRKISIPQDAVDLLVAERQKLSLIHI